MKQNIEKMDFEEQVREKLLTRGFKKDTLINNRGLIGATIEEVILMTVKNCSTLDASQRYTDKDMEAAYDKGYMDGAHTTSDPY